MWSISVFGTWVIASLLYLTFGLKVLMKLRGGSDNPTNDDTVGVEVPSNNIRRLDGRLRKFALTTVSSALLMVLFCICQFILSVMVRKFFFVSFLVLYSISRTTVILP